MLLFDWVHTVPHHLRFAFIANSTLYVVATALIQCKHAGASCMSPEDHRDIATTHHTN